MNPILLRYVGVALVAAIAGLGGGVYIANNNTPQTTPLGAVSAVPAEPFPGAGIPAIPAIPATPVQKPEKENTIVIIRPVGSRGYVKGLASGFPSELPIEWSWNLPKGTKTFDINLLKRGQFFRKINTVRVSISDATFWLDFFDIPNDLPTGNDYTVEVVLVRGKNINISAVSKPFSILDDTITINSHLVDRYTRSPMANVAVQPGYIPTGSQEFVSTGQEIISDAEGRVTFSKKLDFGSQFHQYSAQCYMPGWIRPSFSYWFNSLDLYSMTRWVGSDYTITPILNNTIDREIEMWPAAHLQVVSDIPVKVSVDYSGFPASSFGSIGWYNFNTLSKSHRIENIFPLDYKNGVEVVLIDEAGNKYYSPEYRIDRDRKCDPVTLNFANKEFKWGQ